MSHREKQIEEKISQLEGEKRILDGIKAYYDRNLSYSELEEISGVSIIEFKRYQKKHDYPYRLAVTNKKSVLDKADQRINEIDKTILQQKGSVFGALDQLMFIPSWRKLLGSKFNGFYLNQPVQKILQDNVVLLPDIALSGFEETTGEPFFLITGFGIYWVKFQLGEGSLVTDYREITGIVLPLDIYEKAQDEAGSVLKSGKIRMTDYLVSIPFSLILAKRTIQMYTRGVLARNVFLPNKECFDQLLASCKDPSSFNPNDGLKILSGGMSTQIPLYANELLTEKDLGNYSNLLAGIKNVQPKLNKILVNLQLDSMREGFFTKIHQMKREFREIGRDYLLDWMPGHLS
ncbi:MAG: hypothetical protein ACXADY_20495 [Candidatus Hodarchaeales archaeon]|jgi:hypothetical protein